MSVIYQQTWGRSNSSKLISGVPVAVPGLRLIDFADLVGPENTNRPLLALLANDQEMNAEINETSRLFTDGVFQNFGEAFLVVQSGTTNNTAISFQVHEGLGKITNQAFHVKYVPFTTFEDTVDDQGNYVALPIPPQVTTVNIDVQNLTTNSFRRDLIVLNNAGQIVVLQGAVQTFLPADYSQHDAPANTIALYSILFTKTTGIVQTPQINPVFDIVKIEGVDLIQRFAELFGNGIFIGEPKDVTDPTLKEFFPAVLGGNQLLVNAGSALINGGLVIYGTAGSKIALSRATFAVGTGSTPGAIQGQNTNGWEFVDFTSTSAGAAGVGNGNTQFLKFDNLGLTGLIDPATIVIFTASPVGEGGYSVQRPFGTNIFAAVTTEEYDIDLPTGTIKRQKTTAPLRIFITYDFYRNRRYLPYVDQFGTLHALQSADVFPGVPPEFLASQLPINTIGLKSILVAATDSTLQPSNFGQDFRTYMNFQLVNGQVTSLSIQDGAVTSSKIASGAINNPNQIAPGTIVQENLSQALQNSLSSSKVYARNSLATIYNGFTNVYSFADHTDGTGATFTKELSDINGVPLIYTDAELQTPADRPVVFKNIFKSFVNTEISTDPTNSTATFILNTSNLGNITIPQSLVNIDAISLSFSDFGFSQVGNCLVQIYDPLLNTVLGTVQVPLATIRAAITGQTSAFFKFVFPTPIQLTLTRSYQIRVSKTISTDTLFLHTASDGAGRQNDLAYRVFYLPTAGKYGLMAGQVQGYRIFDDFGDITVASQSRVAVGKPASYIPYAASITDISSFNVFTDVDSTVSNYVAVDVTTGIYKFTLGFEPTTARMFTDHNLNQGFNRLSSERIHRPGGPTIESALRILEEELGSVNAHVRNHLEKLYFLGSGKFRFSSQDRNLSDLGGANLRLQDGNLVNPIHVIDNQFLVPAGRETERDIHDSFNDVDVIEFTARFNNIAILAIDFTNAGTDYDAVQVILMNGPHVAGDFTNPPIASASLAKAAIKSDFNFFTLQAQLVVGQKYHVYIKVINFLGGLAIRPKMLVDVETGAIEYEEYFIPAPGKYGTLDGYTIFDEFGDLNLGSEARGSIVDVSQENFLDPDGIQVPVFFDDNPANPSAANSAFPGFSPSKPSTTGMVRFDVYFKSVPGPGQNGFNGVFRMQLRDSNDNAVIPANALPGNDFLDVRIPKVTGWTQIPFVASLKFGQTYYMHAWSNGANTDFFDIATDPVLNQKTFRYVAGDRFIPFAADLSGDNFDTFQIVSTKLVAVDVVTGRIKFNEADIVPGNEYFADFNLFTKTANIQSDTIVRPNGETIENALINTVSVLDSSPTRIDIGLFKFNPRSIKLVDALGRVLERHDGELTKPYERASISDTNTAGVASTLTTTETDNTYTFFIDNYEPALIPSIVLNFNTVTKSSYNTIMNIYQQGNNTALAQAYIRSTDLVTGFNTIILEDVSGQPLNFVAQPNLQYVLKFAADVHGPGTAPKLSRNNNNSITATINIQPTQPGFYGTKDGVTIKDDQGDIYRYNIDRDDKGIPVVLRNTDSGLIHLRVAHGTTRGVVLWQENNVLSASRYDLSTGATIDTAKLTVTSGSAAIQPDMAVADDVAYTVWVQSGQVFGRRMFLNNTDPFSVDTIPFQISTGGSGVAYPAVTAGRDRFAVAWEDTRDTPSGTIHGTLNSTNIFAWSFNNATTTAQFVTGTNANGPQLRVNTRAITGATFRRPAVSLYKDRSVVVYQSDINNIGLSNDIFLAVYDLKNTTLTRSDIRTDKAPVLSVTTQVDSITPRISAFRNQHAISWLDNRAGGYQIFGKVYDSNSLTFNQNDVMFESSSGIVNHHIDASEKILTVSFANGTDGFVKRIDFGSITDHDETPWNINFNSTLPNQINDVFAISNGKIIQSLALDVSGNAIINSTLGGVNIEPIAADLSDTTRQIPAGYIGIDVVNNIFKFAEGEEI